MASDFEGYQAGDITYCLRPDTADLFPVRVERVYRDSLEVVSLNEALCAEIAPEFTAARDNRRFRRPRLPTSARFGGYDERLVNSKRVSGEELRLLPTHYNTTATVPICERHAAEPEWWPLPTGQVYERWFRQRFGEARVRDAGNTSR